MPCPCMQLDMRDPSGRSAVDWATASGRLEATCVLIEAGAHVDEETETDSDDYQTFNCMHE